MKRVTFVLMVSALLAAGCGGKKDRPFTIAFIPKITGIPYFTACEKGAREAAEELGIELKYDGPTDAKSELQIPLLEGWIASGECDCLAVACTEMDQVSPTLSSARDKGMPVVTYDADSQPGARDYFVNMANYDDVAHAMVDELIAQLPRNPKGKVSLVTSSLEAPNQSQWAKRIRKYIKKWPGLEVLEQDVVHGENRDLGVKKVQQLIDAEKDGLVGIIGLTSVAVPAAARAVELKKMKGKIVVTGVSTPRDMKNYVESGTVTSFILWNPVDLGYLTVWVCHLQREGKMVENGTINAGRLGKITVKDRVVLLGKPMKFTKANIDKVDF